MCYLEYQGLNGTIVQIRPNIEERVEREMRQMEEEVRIMLLADWASSERDFPEEKSEETEA